MDFELISIAVGDVLWIAVPFAFGLLAQGVGLPALVGFIATGFLLGSQGVEGGETLRKLSDLGITLLLFTVGLKLNLGTLARPQVWAVGAIHMVAVVTVAGFSVFLLALIGVPFLADLDFPRALLIAFALSFSSTVFAVKVLEAKGEMTSLHGRIAIGILILQDLIAVVFLAASTGKWPSYWAFAMLGLLPLMPLLHHLLNRVGRGELMVLYGFLLALGGAKAFEMVGLKGDLDALVLGVIMARHAKADELAKTMLGFKDLFLLAFFLSIGLSGEPTDAALLMALALTPFVLAKGVLFFGLMTALKLRARTSLLAGLSLTNYSEFGLIVAAIGVAEGWLAPDWLVILAISLSLSFAVAAGLDRVAHKLYAGRRAFWKDFQRPGRLTEDQPLHIGGATIAVIGLGRIGSGAYDRMREKFGDTVVGIDMDPARVSDQRDAGRNVLLGDPSDEDFWDRVQAAHTLKLVMLALPTLTANLAVLNQLKAIRFDGRIAATVRFQDEAEELTAAGATTVFNVYTEAGTGFASHVLAEGEEEAAAKAEAEGGDGLTAAGEPAPGGTALEAAPEAPKV